MKIELILLGIIGVVFLIDFLMKGVKKKTESNDMVKAGEEEVNVPKQRKGRYIYYLYAFVVSIIIGIISTYLINYFYSGVSLETFINDFIYFLPYHISNFIVSFGITLIFIGFVLYKKNGFLKKISLKGRFTTYILARKKNITLSIILIPLLKVIFHYTIYPIMTQDCLNCGGSRVPRVRELGPQHRDTLGKHFDRIFENELWLFIPAIVILLLIVWFFNDKIKAR